MAKKVIQMEVIVQERVFPSFVKEGGTLNASIREVKLLNQHNLSEKEQKELNSFCAFVSSKEFGPCLKNIGVTVSSILTITLNSLGDDPPDITLKYPEGGDIGIEITDYPQNTAVLTKAFSLVNGPCSVPGVSQTDTNFRRTLDYMNEPESRVRPRTTDYDAECRALEQYLIDQLRWKDVKGNTLVLLVGSFLEHPEVDIVKAVVPQLHLKYIKCVVAVLQNKSIPVYIDSSLGAP